MQAIVLAAGNSTRMGPGREKQFERVGGKPMMIFALERLLEHPSIEHVFLTSRADRLDAMAQVLESYELGESVTPVEGGATRQASVLAGLRHVTSPRVLVHEAARPVITMELIERVVDSDAAAVVPVIEIPFTVAAGTDVMTAEIERDTLRNVQLPQVFDTAKLLEAHEYAVESGGSSTEDSQLMFRRGHEVVFVDGLVENIKVTYPEDIAIASGWIFGAEGLA